ncbi:hypothetical protein CTAYLR_009126 [Chrysophaeum taylorii]|uniref:K Homology domain-containing protein n=1 Tax=Chrysophaeum taylorii TaxID=2483200 RepID=A0AAD7ULH5_9STRA|nr:hypothetical protein CTAYLR_009126 [Chrysophaeum taylorii]
MKREPPPKDSGPNSSVGSSSGGATATAPGAGAAVVVVNAASGGSSSSSGSSSASLAAAPPPASAAPESPGDPKRPNEGGFKSPLGVMNFIIPTNSVSGVIGKGGATVREIVRTTRCRVSVACQTARPVVVLIGGSRERLAALREIRRLVADEAALSMLVPERQLGLVIGKAGAHIADVAARTNAQLSLSRESYPDSEIPAHVPRDGPQKELTLTGDFEAVQNAVDLVLAKLDEHFPTEILASGRDVHRGAAAALGRGVLPLQTRGLPARDAPASATPLLDALSARQRGAVPPQPYAFAPPRPLPAGGANGGPQSAPAATASSAPAATASPPAPPHPTTLRPLVTPRRPPSFPQQQQQSFFPLAPGPPLLGVATLQQRELRVEARPNLMVSIPKREVGGYIGKDGAHVRELERLSGARISVESSKGEADKASTVTFRGTIDENVRAYQLTVQLLAELHHASANAINTDQRPRIPAASAAGHPPTTA